MGDQEELATLRQEVIRLTQELDQTSSEKIQSAQYGLVLLEEKENLEARCQVCYELENAKVCVSNYLNGIVVGQFNFVGLLTFGQVPYNSPVYPTFWEKLAFLYFVNYCSPQESHFNLTLGTGGAF